MIDERVGQMRESSRRKLKYVGCNGREKRNAEKRGYVSEKCQLLG